MRRASLGTRFAPVVHWGSLGALVLLGSLCAIRLFPASRLALLEQSPSSWLSLDGALPPHDGRPEFILGMREARNGRPSAGLQQVLVALRKSSRSAEYLLGLAEIRMNLGDSDGALEAARSAVAAAPGDATAHRVLGEMLLDVDQPDPALREFETAVRLGPNDALNQLALGRRLLFERGRVADARVALERAVSLAPSLVEARRELGLALLKYGEFERAETHLRAAVGADGTDAHALAALGAVLRRRVRSDAARAEARDLLERATRSDPVNTTALHELGMLHLDESRWSEARSTLEQAVLADPTSQGAWLHLSQACERLGYPGPAAHARERFRTLAESQAALAAALAEVDRNPGSVSPRLEAARIYLRRSDFPQAGRQLRAIEELEPGSPRARAAWSEYRMAHPNGGAP